MSESPGALGKTHPRVSESGDPGEAQGSAFGTTSHVGLTLPGLGPPFENHFLR